MWLHHKHGGKNIQVKQNKFGVTKTAERRGAWNILALTIHHRLEAKNSCLHSSERRFGR